ncbi:MAG: DUF4922 domain-containing protein [Deltaproteobacteria bacterium]|nr:DUF4922 domain-containing protein [Deltaproteobacteria bacterium]
MALSEKTKEGPERGCFAVFDGTRGTAPLADLAAALLARQEKDWPGLAGGYEALEEAGWREIRGEGWGVKVQFNPRRIVSSGANLDPESIRRRPCFLCLDHLPPEQQAILYRDDYLVLCNPMPIFPGHLTIAHRRHLPQLLLENIPTFLRLSADFGSRMILLYNGPCAGASAPNHLHFQAAPAGLLPVEKEILDPRKRTGTRRRKGVQICRTAGLARGILVIEGKEEGNVAAAVGEVIGMLCRSATSGDEPLLNLLCTRSGEGWRLALFPRLKHRPDAYFREGEERLLISPGAADMGGLLITPREQDFRKLTPELVAGIFREVAFDDAAVDSLLNSL